MKREIVLGILLASALLAPSGAEARLLEVPHRYPTITQACQAAFSHDTVAVYPGIYSEYGIPVRAGVTVLGMGTDSTDVKVWAPLDWPAFDAGAGAEPVVLENMEIRACAGYMGIVSSSNDSLIVRRCSLRHDCPTTLQWAATIHTWEGSAAIRKCRIDFGEMFAVQQWVFAQYVTAGHFVLEDCVVVISPWAYAEVYPETPVGTVYECTNNTIQGMLWVALEYPNRHCSLYMVNNIVEMTECFPGSAPTTLEWRYNCLESGSLDPACGYQIGNFVADPLFCKAGDGDYRLQPNSPCIGAGEHGENVGARLGVCWPTDVSTGTGTGAPAPKGLEISGPWPNPTSGGVSLLLHGSQRVSGDVTVLDVLGNVVAQADMADEGGMARIRWDGRTNAGGLAPSGIYYLHVPQPGGQGASSRIVVLR